MALDLDKIRSETPGVKSVNHLLACGSALMPQQVLDAVVEHLELEARVGGYEAHSDKFEMLEHVYDQVARLIGAKPNEIALVENATVAWCQAFYALQFKPGDRILTCQAEYGANYVAFLQRAKRDGIEICVVPNDDSGALDVAALENMIDERTALIAITWVPTNGGLVNPAAEVGRIANQAGVPYLLDACQAIGQMPVNVAELGCDFLSATGRKFLRAPRGTGFLYVREKLIETLEPVVIDYYAARWVAPEKYVLRDDARRFENWENAYALRAGLGVAAQYACDLGLENIQKRAWGLAERLREQLVEIAGIEIFDIGGQKSATVSFVFEGHDNEEVVAAMREQNICIGSVAPGGTLLDFEARNLSNLLRAAPHYYNSDDEIAELLAALGDMVRS